ncbi:MAG TPA: SurA N-terminal domain-containing protein [Xanthobacteraceae bacterium]|jgi:peptidyl-prolyl cis-trans isomerase D|nr:SurA N-terminal domain-containing protein [Xanthobacteraceae bacterium]
MLRGIRKASANWLGRIVMGVVMTLLAGSFAIWGINDIFRGFGRSTVAKIGPTEIPIEQFRQTYNDAVQMLGRQSGHVVTPDEAMARGMPRQVLSEMVAEAGLNERARQMRLGVSNDEISKRIITNPAFQNQQGQFDRARFEDAMRNAGFNEKRFVTEQRNLTLRRQIVDSVSGNIPLPNAWLDAINQFQNQERSIAYIALGPAQAGDVPAPTEEELSKYFAARKITFRAPEYRKVATVVATPAELAKTAEVPDEDVKQIFDTYRNRYITPERRRVEQMPFPSMAEAQAASERIKGGLTFSALGAERGLKEQDLDLGTVPKSTLIDPAVADAAFSLKEGEVSAPVQGKFGVVIVTVSKIIPEEAKTFADVAPQIRNEIAMARVKKTVLDVHDKIEEARAGGATLEEAAQKLKLPVVAYDAIDRSGRDPAGKPIANFPRAAELVNAAFSTDVGVDNDPLEADGGYIWYDVAAITPARERNLDEVKSQVEAQWRDDEIASRLKTKAADILDKLKSGSTLETMAAADGVKVQTATAIKRGKAPEPISARMIDAIFHTALDAYASAEGDKPTQWIVFRVTDVKTPKFEANTPNGKALDEMVTRQVSDDVFGQYMAWLENDLGTSVNQSALQQALGNSAPDTN